MPSFTSRSKGDGRIGRRLARCAPKGSAQGFVHEFADGDIALGRPPFGFVKKIVLKNKGGAHTFDSTRLLLQNQLPPLAMVRPLRLSTRRAPNHRTCWCATRGPGETSWRREACTPVQNFLRGTVSKPLRPTNVWSATAASLDEGQLEFPLSSERSETGEGVRG
jgi:hypothetical protein